MWIIYFFYSFFMIKISIMYQFDHNYTYFIKFNQIYTIYRHNRSPNHHLNRLTTYSVLTNKNCSWQYYFFHQMIKTTYLLQDDLLIIKTRSRRTVNRTFSVMKATRSPAGWALRAVRWNKNAVFPGTALRAEMVP